MTEQALLTALLAAVKNDPAVLKTLTKALNSPKEGLKSATKAKAKVEATPAKSERSLKNEELVRRNFKKAGYKDAEPHVNVLTYGRWEAVGRKVKSGEKSVKCGTLRLFHYDQTSPMTASTEAAPVAPAVPAVQPTALPMVDSASVDAKLAALRDAAKAKAVAEAKPTVLPLSEETVLIPATAMAAAMAKANGQDKPYDKRAD